MLRRQELKGHAATEVGAVMKPKQAAAAARGASDEELHGLVRETMQASEAMTEEYRSEAWRLIDLALEGVLIPEMWATPAAVPRFLQSMVPPAGNKQAGPAGKGMAGLGLKRMILIPNASHPCREAVNTRYAEGFRRRYLVMVALSIMQMTCNLLEMERDARREVRRARRKARGLDPDGESDEEDLLLRGDWEDWEVARPRGVVESLYQLWQAGEERRHEAMLVKLRGMSGEELVKVRAGTRAGRGTTPPMSIYSNNGH